MNSSLEALFDFVVKSEERRKNNSGSGGNLGGGFSSQFPSQVHGASSALHIPSPSPQYPGAAATSNSNSSSEVKQEPPKKKIFSFKKKDTTTTAVSSTSTVSLQQQQSSRSATVEAPRQQQQQQQQGDFVHRELCRLFDQALHAAAEKTVSGGCASVLSSLLLDSSNSQSTHAVAAAQQLKLLRRFHNLQGKLLGGGNNSSSNNDAIAVVLPGQMQQNDDDVATRKQDFIDDILAAPDLTRVLLNFLIGQHDNNSASPFVAELSELTRRALTSSSPASASDHAGDRRQRAEGANSSGGDEECALYRKVLNACATTAAGDDDCQRMLRLVGILDPSCGNSSSSFFQRLLGHCIECTSCLEKCPEHLALLIAALNGSSSKKPSSSSDSSPDLLHFLVFQQQSDGASKSISHLSDLLILCEHQQQDASDDDTDGNNFVHTLLAAFRSTVFTKIFPPRMFAALQQVVPDDDASRSSSTCPQQSLSFFAKSGAQLQACADTVAMDGAFSANIAVWMRRLKQQEPLTPRAVECAKAVLLLTPFFGATTDRAAMLPSESNKNNNKESGDNSKLKFIPRGEIIAVKSPAKNYSPTLELAVDIIVKRFCPSTLPPPSSSSTTFRTRLVAFLVAVRSALSDAGAAPAGIGGGSADSVAKSQGSKIFTALETINAQLESVPALLASVPVSAVGALTSFLVDCVVSVGEVIVFATSLLELQTAHLDAEDALVTPFLSTSFDGRRILQLLFGKGKQQQQNEQQQRPRPVSFDDDDDDDDRGQTTSHQQQQRPAFIPAMMSLQQQQKSSSSVAETHLLRHVLRWGRTLLIAFGRCGTEAASAVVDETTGGGGFGTASRELGMSGRDDNIDKRQAEVLVHLGDLVVSASNRVQQQQQRLGACEKRLFICFVLRELLCPAITASTSDAASKQMRVTVQCLCGDEAQSGIGAFALRCFETMTGSKEATTAVVDVEVDGFLKAVVKEMEPLLSRQAVESLEKFV